MFLLLCSSSAATDSNGGRQRAGRPPPYSSIVSPPHCSNGSGGSGGGVAAPPAGAGARMGGGPPVPAVDAVDLPNGDGEEGTPGYMDNMVALFGGGKVRSRLEGTVADPSGVGGGVTRVQHSGNVHAIYNGQCKFTVACRRARLSLRANEVRSDEMVACQNVGVSRVDFEVLASHEVVIAGQTKLLLLLVDVVTQLNYCCRARERSRIKSL